MSDAASPEPAATEASDAALISRIRAGDMSAYAQLYERHLAAARTLARHLIGADAAEDVVQDAFAKVLDVLRRGGGPRSGFRPYLLTAVRRTVYDRYRGERRLQSTDQIEMYDTGVPFVDPALEGLERSMIARAFRSLPERWQTVLWHTEVEGAKPAEVAPLLGLTPNGVAALAYRAREGLRQAYLQMHLPSAPAAPLDAECRATLDKLGPYVRGGLPRRESRLVGRHLDGCERCKAIYAEMTVINSALRDVIGPLFLGTATAAYIGAAKGGSVLGGVLGRLWRLKRRWRTLGGGTAAVLAALVGLVLVLMSGSAPIRPAPGPPTRSPSPVLPRKAPKSPAAQPPPAATASAPYGLMRDGLPARFAAGGTRVVHAGNALLTCDRSHSGCRRALRREGDRRDSDRWRMRRLDEDGSPATKASSAARVRLPGRPGRVGAVAGEGDAALPGDRLLLVGRPLTPRVGRPGSPGMSWTAPRTARSAGLCPSG
ncbi:hypothetical protein Acsp04_42460 [Actinomadura sp. NBRC 104425]|uniref:sigma-70 family RNA polymerase sigma factor n=1 Tax=Actinomadura sp. NBRC 104425 TaxID=3032204 RepID=UPI0024A3BE8F|nr:sigma-70 family RNA polymerase sigma factor [Actinomadura sp. NBRC 104425]GLZ14011.1 hypothetical protein Acsp04_42460 [Actinomadura sp. NBRC 104425]